jgi:putative transposase
VIARFQALKATVDAMGIEEVLTAPSSPWQNAYAERFIGSVRRESLDHVIVLSAAGLRQILKSYVGYYTTSRTHLSLEKDSPAPRQVTPPGHGRVIAVPQVGGLHHRYDRLAA